MSMHYDSESLVDRGRSPRLFALLVIIYKNQNLACLDIANYIADLLSFTEIQYEDIIELFR